MSFFRGIRRIWNETKEDINIITESKGRQPVFNTSCRFRDFGFKDENSHFYSPPLWSALPSTFIICQECFITSIAPTPFAGSFGRVFKEPGQFVQCDFSNPLNKSAWKACVEIGTEAPLVQHLKESAVLQANLSLCPMEAASTGPLSNGRNIGFHALKSQIQNNDSFNICEHHYATTVQATWAEDEFACLPQRSSDTFCDFGSSDPWSRIAFIFAKQNTNTKIFEEWTLDYRRYPRCTRFIQPGRTKYILPIVQEPSASQVQFCETCYRLILAPHAVLRSHFQEISGTQCPSRALCSFNHASAYSYMEVLLKVSWKQDATIFLDFARNQPPIPPCPGSFVVTDMEAWYGSEALPGFVSCENCYQEIILPSHLHASFERLQKEEVGTVHNCEMAFDDIRTLFANISETGGIDHFRAGMEEITRRAQSAQVAEQVCQTSNPTPEEHLTAVRETPQEMQQLEMVRFEMRDLRMAIDRLNSLGAEQARQGAIMRGMGGGSELIGNPSPYEVSDGYGNWFANRSLADSSALQIQAERNWKEAMRLQSILSERSFQLETMEKSLTGTIQ
ncbi:hypothetical protein BGZ60DRAFT_524150 [Tricladium varicosporioides]|nr:hypothetical protein BGZ60DRAFT_524150 [Hymenoscyphus varicosporioides]